ncbi:MAG TPA: hypothetical protein VL088_12725, partial [Pedobacter sp.]|nr:hypothetical protein [Pedobacter sp.]
MRNNILAAKKCKPLSLLAVFIFIQTFCAYAQTEKETKDAEKLVPREFAIPASPLFDLLGAAPNQVARTSNLKDFKVDWSFKN